MAFVGIKSQVLQTKFLQHILYLVNILWRTKPLPSPALKVACTSEVSLQATHEYLILAGQHLLLHRREAPRKHLWIVRAIEFALLRRLRPMRIDNLDNYVIFSKHLPRLLAQAMFTHRAFRHDAERIAVRH